MARLYNGTITLFGNFYRLLRFGGRLDDRRRLFDGRCGLLRDRLIGVLVCNTFVFRTELLVILRYGHLHVGCQPKNTDAECENAKEQPTEKAEYQQEEFPFVVLHHHAAFAKHTDRIQFGMVVQDERHHGVC